jgi:hypothetical protein
MNFPSSIIKLCRFHCLSCTSSVGPYYSNMSSKIPINTNKALKALPGIYNQAIVANGMVFCSGAIALDKDTMSIIDGDIRAHTVGLTMLVGYDKEDLC